MTRCACSLLIAPSPDPLAPQDAGCDAKIASGGGRMGVTMDRCERAGWECGCCDLNVPSVAHVARRPPGCVSMCAFDLLQMRLTGTL